MQAVVFPHGGFRVPSIFTLPKLGRLKPASGLYSREIADGTLRLSNLRGVPKSLGSTIRCEGNRKGRPRRKTSSDDTAKEIDHWKGASVSGGEKSRASSQKEIIDLFRRIQTSISNEPPVSKKRISRNLNEGNRNVSRTAGPAVGSSKSNSRKKKLTDDEMVNNMPPEMKEFSSPEDFKLTRPMSNFEKRSPIPQPSLMKKVTKEMSEETSKAKGPEHHSEMKKIDDMKVSELKELAREKGIKSYSKMKKGELLEVLNGILQSSK